MNARPNFADFTAYGPDGGIVAIIEAKRQVKSTPRWATELRDSLVSGSNAAAAPFFVIVTADFIYVWRGPAEPSAPPNYVVDATPVLAPYFERTGFEPATIYPMGFEALVGLWLADLAAGRVAVDPDELRASGLVEAMSGTELDQRDAA